MGAVTRVQGSRTSLTITLNSLANDTYVASSAVDVSATDPVDVVIDIEVTPGTVSGDKALPVFVQISMNGGTDYTTGPTSGTTATDEPNLYGIGSLPLGTNSTLQRGAFSLFQALGFIPTHFKVVVRNRSGAALAGSGNAASYTVFTGNVA